MGTLEQPYREVTQGESVCPLNSKELKHLVKQPSKWRLLGVDPPAPVQPSDYDHSRKLHYNFVSNPEPEPFRNTTVLGNKCLF